MLRWVEAEYESLSYSRVGGSVPPPLMVSRLAELCRLQGGKSPVRGHNNVCYTQINVQGAVPEKRICATQSPPSHNRNRPFRPPPLPLSFFRVEKIPRPLHNFRENSLCSSHATHSSDLINYHVVFRAIPGGRWWCGARTAAGSWAGSSAGASGAPSPTCPASAPASPSSGTGSWQTRPDNGT